MGTYLAQNCNTAIYGNIASIENKAREVYYGLRAYAIALAKGYLDESIFAFHGYYNMHVKFIERINLAGFADFDMGVIHVKQPIKEFAYEDIGYFNTDTSLSEYGTSADCALNINRKRLAISINFMGADARMFDLLSSTAYSFTTTYLNLKGVEKAFVQRPVTAWKYCRNCKVGNKMLFSSRTNAYSVGMCAIHYEPGVDDVCESMSAFLTTLNMLDNTCMALFSMLDTNIRAKALEREEKEGDIKFDTFNGTEYAYDALPTIEDAMTSKIYFRGKESCSFARFIDSLSEEKRNKLLECYEYAYKSDKEILDFI